MCDRFRVIFFVKKNFLYYNPMSEEINSFTINTTSQNHNGFDFLNPVLPVDNGGGIIYYGEDCIIGPMMPPAFLVGDTGIGKSVFVVDFAIDIAAGRSPLGAFVTKTDVNVFLATNDGAEAMYKKYVYAAATIGNFTEAERCRR